MKTVTVSQIQALDDHAIRRLGIPSLALMETAGHQVAAEVLRHCRRTHKRKVLIVCGAGNNAGDGFVVARWLMQMGLKVGVMMVSPAVRLKHDAKVYYQAARKLKIPMLRMTQQSRRRLCRQSDVIVDAVFGVGLNRDVSGGYAQAIEAINTSGKYVVAVDIPSGLNGDTGEVLGCCVKASTTVTFSFAKRGMVKPIARKYVGRLKVVDIGIPKSLLK